MLRADDVVLVKGSRGVRTDLVVERLAALDVRRVVLCGVSTESCVAATARDAFAHDLQVVLVSDATASVDPDEHDHTLEMLRVQHRQQVRTADEVVAAWDGHDAEGS